MHCLEGGFYMAGLAFLSTEMAMPQFVKLLGGSPSLTAVMPILLPAMFALPGLFVAPLVERLHHLKPFVITFGALQRLPYLVTGLVLLFAHNLDGWLLPVVVLTPIVSGLIGGIGVNAWMEMVTRMIPPHQRASGWAIRYVIQGVIGLSAGPAIHFILGWKPGAEGFAILHLICFGFLVLSYVSQLRMIEVPENKPLRLPRSSYPVYIRELPLLFRSAPKLMRLVFVRFTGLGFLMMISFLTDHALHVSQRKPEDVGHLVLANMVGALCGNILASWLGNRLGGRFLMVAARCICLGLCLVVTFVTSFEGFLAVSFMWGFGLFLDRVGDLTFSAELCPTERRPTYQAILALCQGVNLLLAWQLSSRLFTATESFTAVIILCGSFAATSLLLLALLPEVRTREHLPPVMGENPPMA
jgi:MFS family permease